MEKFFVLKGSRRYPVYIGKNILDRASQVFIDQKIQRACLISSRRVANLYLDIFLEKISPALEDLSSIVIPDGEKCKNFRFIENIYLNLIKNKVRRDYCLVSFGGGTVGDITGFIAATYLRGIRWVNFPTTVLSCADSSVGGKVGVNLKAGKNLVGAFYHPGAVFINLDFLKTLSKRQYENGMAEIIKNSIISSDDFFKSLNFYSDKIKHRDLDVVYGIIKKSLEFKVRVVNKDPEEESSRGILNFGHTIGHALEVSSDYKLLHGEAVAIGILGASWLSNYLGMLKKEDFLAISHLLRKYDLIKTGAFFNTGECMECVLADKKHREGSLKMVLLKNIGKPEIMDVTESVVLKTLEYLKLVVR